MARPGRPERNRAARSFRQLKRFQNVINSDKVFGTHSHAPSLEQAQAEAEHAFKRIRDSLSEAEYDEALWKKDGKVRGLN
jgi:hypothetical protein